MNFLFESERLLYRQLSLNDAEALFKMDSDPLVHKYLGNNPKKNIEEVETDIKHILAQYQRNNIGRVAVVLKDTNEFIGWAGLKKVDDAVINGFQNHYDLGYRFLRKFWGNGYASEAAQRSAEFGFIDLNLDTLYAFTDIEHKVSQSILMKIGFQKQGRFIFDEDECLWLELKKVDYLKIR